MRGWRRKDVLGGLSRRGRIVLGGLSSTGGKFLGGFSSMGGIIFIGIINCFICLGSCVCCYIKLSEERK